MKRRPWKRLLGVAFAALFVLGLVVIWKAGSHVIAPSQHAVGQPPSHLRLRADSVPSASGALLSLWLHDVEGSTGTVLLLHPAHGDRRAMLGRARLLIAAGYSVVLPDFQAHGESGGEVFTAGYLERLDVEALIGFVRSRAPATRIGILGWSLGGAAAVLAQPRDVDALVLESVYPSIETAIDNRLAMRLGSLGPHLSPLLTWQLAWRLDIPMDALRPIEEIGNLNCPVLLLAGEDDARTRLEDTRALFARAREPKTLVTFPGAAHVDLFAFDRKSFERAVLPFLAKYL